MKFLLFLEAFLLDLEKISGIQFKKKYLRKKIFFLKTEKNFRNLIKNIFLLKNFN